MSAPALPPAQDTFAQALAQDTGLDLNVVRAWVLQENGGGRANGANNWLGVAITGPGGSYGTNNPSWADPVSAAKLTAAWMRGKVNLGNGYSSSVIQQIPRTASQSPAAQIAAIQIPSSAGGWSGAGEPALAGLYQQVVGGLNFQTISARAIADAANATHVPNFIIAAVYKSGYVGDPTTLAKTLQYWYGAGGGGTSWQRALASWHAGSPSGALNHNDLTYGSKILKDAANLPRNLQGALDTGSILSLTAIVAGGFAITGLGAAAAAGEGAVAGGEGAAAAGAAGTAAADSGAAGSALTATSGLRKFVEAMGVAGALAWLAENWLRVSEFLVGCALAFYGLVLLGRAGMQDVGPILSADAA